MRRWLLAGLVLALVVGVVGWRLAAGDDDWDPDAQFAPSLRPAFGARVDGDRLQIWTGRPCRDVTRVMLTYRFADRDSIPVLLSAPGTTVERFDAGSGAGPLAVQDPLAPGIDWQEAESVSMVLDGPDFHQGSFVDLDVVAEGSPEHDADTYWFQDVGWLDPDAVGEKDGKSFLTTCTPDPAEE